MKKHLKAISRVLFLAMLAVSACHQDQDQSLSPVPAEKALSSVEVQQLVSAVKQDPDFKKFLSEIKGFEILVKERNLRKRSVDYDRYINQSLKVKTDAEARSALSRAFENEDQAFDKLKNGQKFINLFFSKYPKIGNLNQKQLHEIFGRAISEINSLQDTAIKDIAGDVRPGDCMGTCSGAYNAQTNANETALAVSLVGCALTGEIPVVAIACMSGAFAVFDRAQDANLANMGACMCGCGYDGACS